MRSRTLVLVLVAVTVSVMAAFGVGYQIGSRHDADYLNSVRVAAFNDRLTALRVLRENKVPKNTVESMELSVLSDLDTITLDARGSNSAYLLPWAAQRFSAYVREYPDSQLADRNRPRVSQLLTLAPK